MWGKTKKGRDDLQVMVWGDTCVWYSLVWKNDRSCHKQHKWVEITHLRYLICCVIISATKRQVQFSSETWETWETSGKKVTSSFFIMSMKICVFLNFTLLTSFSLMMVMLMITMIIYFTSFSNFPHDHRIRGIVFPFFVLFTFTFPTVFYAERNLLTETSVTAARLVW